jgi:hypothetical protein
MLLRSAVTNAKTFRLETAFHSSGSIRIYRVSIFTLKEFYCIMILSRKVTTSQVNNTGFFLILKIQQPPPEIVNE